MSASIIHVPNNKAHYSPSSFPANMDFISYLCSTTPIIFRYAYRAISNSLKESSHLIYYILITHLNLNYLSLGTVPKVSFSL